MESVARVIADELVVEDRLNEEVREVLVQHASEMERSNVTYTEMFKMLKKKMAREKGIILCGTPGEAVPREDPPPLPPDPGAARPGRRGRVLRRSPGDPAV